MWRNEKRSTKNQTFRLLVILYIYIYNIIKLKKKIYIVVRCYQLFNIYEDISHQEKDISIVKKC